MSDNLTTIIVTLNEEANLPDCLESLRRLDCPTLVIDSGSLDQTKVIARNAGATVIEHPFTSHAEQWQWALRNLPRPTDWVLGLDADQQLTPELGDEIRRLFTENESRLLQLDGLYINRRQVFRGRWVRHGGYYPKYLLKLFRLSNVIVTSDDLVDHHFYVDGPTEKLRYDLIEANRKEDDISFWIAKHNRYARHQAIEEVRARQQGRNYPIEPAILGTPDQRILWIKSRWQRLPLYLRSIGYFYFRFVIQRGFLDGKDGPIFHFLHALWYRLLVDIYVDDLLKQSAPLRQE